MQESSQIGVSSKSPPATESPKLDFNFIPISLSAKAASGSIVTIATNCNVVYDGISGNVIRPLESLKHPSLGIGSPCIRTTHGRSTGYSDPNPSNNAYSIFHFPRVFKPGTTSQPAPSTVWL